MVSNNIWNSRIFAARSDRPAYENPGRQRDAQRQTKETVLMKKILFIVFCVFLLTGCDERIVIETPKVESVSVEKTTEIVVEETPENDLGVSEAVLIELERATKTPRYAYDKKISDGYTREDYVSVTKIEDGDDKFFTYEVVMKDGEKNRVSFRKFLVEE